MLSELEERIGYRFQDKSLLERALTHSSYANEKWKDSLASNERRSSSTARIQVTRRAT